MDPIYNQKKIISAFLTIQTKLYAKFCLYFQLNKCICQRAKSIFGFNSAIAIKVCHGRQIATCNKIGLVHVESVFAGEKRLTELTLTVSTDLRRFLSTREYQLVMYRISNCLDMPLKNTRPHIYDRFIIHVDNESDAWPDTRYVKGRKSCPYYNFTHKKGFRPSFFRTLCACGI